MSPEYCDDKDCPACDVQRHLQHLKDAGCPDETLLEIVIRSLANVVTDIDINYLGELPSDRGTMH